MCNPTKTAVKIAQDITEDTFGSNINEQEPHKIPQGLIKISRGRPEIHPVKSNGQWTGTP